MIFTQFRARLCEKEHVPRQTQLYKQLIPGVPLTSLTDVICSEHGKAYSYISGDHEVSLIGSQNLGP